MCLNAFFEDYPAKLSVLKTERHLSKMNFCHARVDTAFLLLRNGASRDLLFHTPALFSHVRRPEPPQIFLVVPNFSLFLGILVRNQCCLLKCGKAGQFDLR